MKRAVKATAAFLVALAATGSMAVAADTPVPASTETFIQALYAGSTLVRVDDAFDQLWVAEAGNATATARFAGYTNTFGYIGGFSGTPSLTFTDAFTVPGGNGTLAPGAFSMPLPSPSAEFRFGLDANGSGTIYSSLDSDNTDGGLDHMVTYYIASGIGAGNYVIAFEDLPGPLGQGSDRDFNDLIITIAGARPTPEPGTLLLFGSAAAGLFAWSRRSRKAAAKA